MHAGGATGAAEDGETNASPTAPPGRQSLLNDLDHAQMVVLQLAFWSLGVGTLLGAYWADHAWGRFWAWDPKETWALITWIIYLIVIHVRLGVKRRGLVTAWLSVLGFISMLWCYWGVNLLLAGLHSYA
jgi:ABC-type transport system involved in cytochrome c biogenesis permease subunit